MFRYEPSLPGHRPTSESTFETAPGLAAGEPTGEAAGLADAVGLGEGVVVGFGLSGVHATTAIAVTVKIDNRTDLLNLLMFILIGQSHPLWRRIDRLQTCGSFSRSSLHFDPAFMFLAV